MKDRKSTGDRGEEAHTKTGGEEEHLWDPTVCLVRCRAKRQRNVVEIRPNTLAEPIFMWVIGIFLRAKDKLVTKSMTGKF